MLYYAPKSVEVLYILLEYAAHKHNIYTLEIGIPVQISVIWLRVVS